MTLADVAWPDPALLAEALPLIDAPRLLFVVRGAENYGTATKMMGLFESLSSRGAKPGLFALGDGELAVFARGLPGMTVHVDLAPPARLMQRGLPMIRAYAASLAGRARAVRRLEAFLAGGQYDAMVICEHGLVLQTGAAARRSGVPAFWVMANDIHGRYPLDLNRRVYALAFRHLMLMPVANSEHTRGTLGRAARYAGRIDLGINPSRVGSAGPPPRLAIPPGKLRLLVMARLIEAKGQLQLLQAILSDPAFADIHLILCGGPLGTPYAQALRDTAQTAGAADRLHLVGPVSDVATWYAAADVVVNARLDPEPFGLAIVEAMLLGKPILAHALGGPKDIVQDGVTGWHIAAPTSAAFADGLARMLADQARWTEMGEAGRARALRHYTHHTMTDQLLGVIRGRLSAPSRGT